jgi:hypothetical protein
MNQFFPKYGESGIRMIRQLRPLVWKIRTFIVL